MFNPFKRKAQSNNNNDNNGTPKLGMLQRLAMKKLQSMSEKDRMKLMQKFLTPENIQKNRGKIIESMEAMRASGQITEAQLQEARKKLGL